MNKNSECTRRCYLARLERMTPAEKSAHLAQQSTYQAEYRRTHRPQRIAAMREWLHGITQEQFTALRRKQNDRCLGCLCEMVQIRHQPNSCHIDHDHATGKVRGLLCSHCNVALGFLRDNVSTLIRLAAYLQDNREQKPEKDSDAIHA